MKTRKATENSDESFESAYKKLEAVIRRLENEIPDYSIDLILKEYEEGVRLLKLCRKKLSDAELRIEKIGTEEDTQK